MKLLKSFGFIALFLFSYVCGTEQKETTTDNNIITETQVENLNFDELEETALPIAARLADSVNGPQEDASELSACIRCLYSSRSVVVPYSQGLTYVKGVLCHVGNYSHASIITVLEGRNYGLQTTVDYYGYVIATNYTPVVETSYAGNTLKHFYPDCTVVTGMDQVIIFY